MISGSFDSVPRRAQRVRFTQQDLGYPEFEPSRRDFKEQIEDVYRSYFAALRSPLAPVESHVAKAPEGDVIMFTDEDNLFSYFQLIHGKWLARTLSFENSPPHHKIYVASEVGIGDPRFDDPGLRRRIFAQDISSGIVVDVSKPTYRMELIEECDIGELESYPEERQINGRLAEELGKVGLGGIVPDKVLITT